ncbi:MAG: NAD-dependent epimerase/dehydratase family protein [Acidobacteriota bacterium]
MKIFITGGAGFVGTHLTSHLATKGHELLVYDNLSAGNPAPFLVLGDLLEVRALNAAVSSFQPDAIIHLAALHFIPDCERDPSRTLRVNVEGTQNVLAAAAFCETKPNFVFASSAAVYESSSRYHHEDDHPAPSEIYGMTKHFGEQLVKASGLPYSIARLFNVYGPGETNPHLIPALLPQLRAGAHQIHHGNPTTYRSSVYVTDVVEALSRMALHPVPARLCNVPGPGESTASDIVHALARLLDRDISVTVDPFRLRNADRRHLRGDLSAVRRLLGWGPSISLEDGLRRLLAAEPVDASSEVNHVTAVMGAN